MSALEVTAQLAAAQLAVARGWRVFPVDHPDAGLNCAGKHPPEWNPRRCDEKRGKHPACHWPTWAASIPHDKMLTLTFGNEGQPRNVGVACRPSGLFVVDEDVDGALTALAAELGVEVPQTYRVRTARGWHWYFTAPTDIELGNGAGRLADYGMDVRGGHGDGGYVVGSGSVHLSGHRYTAEDEYAAVAELPRWVVEQVLTPSATKTRDSGAGAEGTQGVGVAGWTDEARYGSEVDLLAQYTRHVDEVKALAPPAGHSPNGGEFRHRLFNAARDGWRLVDLGLIRDEAMLNELAGAVRTVWGADPDGDDKRIVLDQARAAAGSSPWVVLGAATTIGNAATANEADGDRVSSNAPTAEEVERRAFERAVVERLRQLDADEEARRRKRARERGEQPSMRSLLIDSNDLDDIAPPEMLLGQFIPRGGVGFLGGDTGTYKSFVAVSWACSLAAGRPWQDDQQFAVAGPVRALYIAAEGPGGVKQRIEAWKVENGPLPRGHLVVYPRPVNLTDPDAVAELAAIVAEDAFEFVVVDTLHRSAPGSEDNSATEFGVVFHALAGIRDEHSATVLIIDHSGHDGARLRGTASKGQDADFVTMATRSGDNSRESQRTLKVTKLKDDESCREFPIRLRAVEGHRMPVVEVGEVDEVSPFGLRSGDWWAADIELPERVAHLRGPGADAARDVYRVLWWTDAEMNVSSLRRACNAAPGRLYSETTLQRGRRLLEGVGAIESPTAPTRYAVVPPPAEL